MRKSFQPNWNLYSAALILLFLCYQLMQWPLLPKFVDIYYHLAVVRGFSDAGGWVPRDYWEFAPMGRPHLYPPFLHAWLLIPYRLGVDPIEIARAVDALAYPALLVSFWFFVRSREGAKTAFWAAFLFSSVYSSFLAAVTLTAYNLAMIGILWAFYFLARGRSVAAGLLAAAVFYTHTMAAGLLAAAFVLAAAMEPPLRRGVLRALGLSFLTALPILAWQAANGSAFTFAEAPENRSLELDPFLYGLALLRVARSFKRRKPDVWPLALFLAMTPMIPLRQTRVIGGYGVLCAAWLAALEILSWTEAFGRARGKKAAGWTAALAALFFMFFAPTYLADLSESRHRLQWMDRSLTRYLIPDEARDFRAKGFSIYFEKEYGQILGVLRARLRPGEVFWTDFPHAGGILYLKSGYAMSTAMLGEVGSWKDREARLRSAKLLVWFKTGRGVPPAETQSVVQKMQLRPVAETDLSVIFENLSADRQSIIPSPVVPIGYIYTLLGVWSAALAFSVARRI